MYEVRCKVSDVKLTSVLRALTGLTSGLPSVMVDRDEEPVAKAPVARPAVHKPYKSARRKPIRAGGTHARGKGAVTIIRKLLANRDVGSTFLSREAVEATGAAGYARGSHSHGLYLLIKEGTIRPLGMGHYEILKKPVQSDTAVQ